MSGNSKTTGYLKECIADAFIELLKSKPMEKITVDEITAKAGVGRATYFRNFHSKEELICYKLTLLWERFCDDNEIAERTRFDLANSRDFFEYNYSIRKTLDIIYRSGLESALFESVKRIMLPDQENGDWYREQFYSYGLFGLLDGWIRRGYSETPQQMADLITEIVRNH